MFNRVTKRNGVSLLAFVSFGLVLSLLVVSSSVRAHPPSNMELDYKYEGGTLNVGITHRVGNTSSHYVEKISVFKNGGLVVEEEYSKQEASDGGDYKYDLDAQNGDRIEVKAACSRFGDISQSIEIQGIPEQEVVLLRAHLTTDAEIQGVKAKTPPSASGIVVALLDKKDNKIEYSLAYEGLSDSPAAAHFHEGDEGEEGPPVRTIFGEPEIKDAPSTSPEGTNAFISGEWQSEGEQPLTEELIETLLSGGIYVNIHTELNPKGEIRAQLEKVG